MFQFILGHFAELGCRRGHCDLTRLSDVIVEQLAVTREESHPPLTSYKIDETDENAA